MITTLLRIIVGRKLRRFSFERNKVIYPTTLKKFGLYIHIPFCYHICPFCPYNKTLYDEALARKYEVALLKELSHIKHMVGDAKISSIYIGGGTPTTMINELGQILSYIRENFHLVGDIGVELHPGDCELATLEHLKEYGVTMVSLGVQSFHRHLLERLNRGKVGFHPEMALERVASCGFETIDVDMLFGIPGESIEMAIEDLREAIRLGATQISVYPLITFNYTPFGRSIKKGLITSSERYLKKRLFQALVKEAKRCGFERSSIWTFTKRNHACYSSITRESFIGIGAGATSSINETFTINTFSVAAYIEAVEGGNLCALSYRLNKRERMLFWLFWQCYNTKIDKQRFKELFAADFERYFWWETFLARALGLINCDDRVIRLTERGAYLFNLVEQSYTHAYLEKAWSICMNDPWPEKIEL